MEKAIDVLQQLRTLGNMSLQYAYSQRHQLEKWYSLVVIIALYQYLPSFIHAQVLIKAVNPALFLQNTCLAAGM